MSPLVYGLGREDDFDQWDVSRHELSRAFKYVCMVEPASYVSAVFMRGTLLQGRDPLQTNQSPCSEEPGSQVAPYPQLKIQPLLKLGCHQKLEYCYTLLSICTLFCLFVCYGEIAN